MNRKKLNLVVVIFAVLAFASTLLAPAIARSAVAGGEFEPDCVGDPGGDA